MSFLEWRKFNFFELKSDVDKESIAKQFKDYDVVVATSGNNHIILGDSAGLIHIISRTWEITTFRGYELRITLAHQLRNSSLLITIGEDEVGVNPLIKVWDIARSKNGIPHCYRVSRAIPGNRPVAASALCVHENLQLMAVGFIDGSLVLYRGEVTRSKGSKQKLLRDTSSTITGLAFKSTSALVFLFVATESSILVYNITHKDKEQKSNLDTIGCAKQCSVLAESLQENRFMVAHKEAIYCYSTDGLGPCFVVDGEKVMLEWFRSYLIVVTNVSKTGIQMDSNISQGQTITILDIQNKFIVFSTTMPKIKAILIEWGGLYVLDCDNRMYHLDEKDLQSKLSLLFKKNLYDISIRIAKSQQYDTDGLIDIFRQYGDHLYSKCDYWGAIEQYAKTIGKLEPSYVIRKFLDSQHIEKLTSYLQIVHRQGQATEDHTRLLLNCYIKLNKPESLKEFILSKDHDFAYDIEIAMKVCRQVSPEEALTLATKHGKHGWYIKIQIEDHKRYKEALGYIVELPFKDADMYMKKYGQILINNMPNECTQFLKRLCTECNNIADPEDYINFFLNHSEQLIEFLEHLITKGCILSMPVYDTLLEHYIHVWNSLDQGAEKNKNTQKILKLLQNSEIKYDKAQALVVCHMHGFSEGVLYLYEEEKLYQQILRYHISRGDTNAVLLCCKRFEHQEPTLWIQALWSCIRKSSVFMDILPEVLNAIAKENLLSPQLIIEAIGTDKSDINLGHIRSYIISMLEKENKLTKADTEQTNKYRTDTTQLKQQIETLKNSVIAIQGSHCAACNHQLALPSVHFLCQHSYHQHCFQSFSENENDCPACVPQNRNLIERLKSQECNKDPHETFHSYLEKGHDGIALAADYFSRGIFKKVTVIVDEPPPPPQKSKPSYKTDPLNYGPGVEAKLRQAENTKSGGQILIPTPEGRMRIQEMQYNAPVGSKRQTKVSKNSIDTYDESKNPFFLDLENTNPFKDDYNKNLNPFES